MRVECLLVCVLAQDHIGVVCFDLFRLLEYINLCQYVLQVYSLLVVVVVIIIVAVGGGVSKLM